jgi:hypothetical protein
MLLPNVYAAPRAKVRMISVAQVIDISKRCCFVSSVGLDLSLIVAELLEERDLICRGLGHPVIFNQTKYPELRGRTPGLRPSEGGNGGANSFLSFQEFGAVAVTPRNYYKLLQSGQNGLLFPGGVKDVFQVDPSYPLLWPDKPDFVR